MGVELKVGINWNHRRVEWPFSAHTDQDELPVQPPCDPAETGQQAPEKTKDSARRSASATLRSRPASSLQRAVGTPTRFLERTRLLPATPRSRLRRAPGGTGGTSNRGMGGLGLVAKMYLRLDSAKRVLVALFVEGVELGNSWAAVLGDKNCCDSSGISPKLSGVQNDSDLRSPDL